MNNKIFKIFLTFIILFSFNSISAKESNKENESFANIVLFAYFNGDSEGKEYLINNYSNYKKYYEEDTVLSVKGYLNEISYGKFNLVNYFHQEKDGVLVPYELSISEDDLDKINNDYTIIHSIIKNLNISGTIDYDGDGYVDNLTIILKGGSGSVSSNSTLVSHKGDYIENSDTINSKNIFHYNMLNTYSIDLNGAGVISHEFLHTLGYPDLYTSEENNIPVYIWDIMGAVSYKMSYPLAYNRMYFSKWIDIDEITESKTITLNSQDDKDGNQAYILKSPFNEYELFVVEYRKSGYTSDVNNKKLDGMIYYPGVIIYRINTTVEGLSNHFGSTGEYVFRTSSNSSDRTTIISELTHAALSESSITSYGSSDLTKTDNIISYSDGSNSGIVISDVHENLDGSYSLNVSIPESDNYDLWNSINYDDTLTSESINKYSDIAYFNNKLYMVNVGNNKIITSTYSNNNWSSNIEQSVSNTNYLSETSLFEMNNNLYMLLSFYDSVKLYKLNDEWELISTLDVSNNEVSYKVLNNELYLNLIDDYSSDAYIYKYSNGSFNCLKKYYSGFSDIGTSNIENIGDNLYYILRKSNGNIIIYDKDYNSISNNLNSNTYDVVNYNNKLYFALGADTNNEYLRIASYDGNNFNIITTDVKQGFPSLVVSEGNLYVIATDTSSSGKTIVYSYDENNKKLVKEGENVDNAANTTNLNLISNSNKIYVLFKRLSDNEFTIKVKETVNNLLSLSITSPNKTTYYKGDKLDLTGLVVKANYTLEQKEVTNYSISNFNTDSVGTFNAIISYEGKSTTFTYNVVNKINDETKLYKINVSSNNSVVNVISESMENESISFSVNANFGYKIKSISVVDSNNNLISISNNTFNMPSSDVTIKVVTDYKRFGDNQINKIIKSNYNSITISWERIVDAKGYYIYRSTNGKTYTKYKTITSNKTTTLTDKSLKTGTTYYYKVRAYKVSGKKTIYSKYSNVVSKKLVLNTPKLTGYDNTYSYARITYTKVSGASGYYIYRLGSNGKYTKIGTTTSLEYKDKTAKSDINYIYVVKAYRKVGNKKVSSSSSNKVISKRLNDSISFNLVKGKKSITINIKKNPTALKYYIYRSTSKYGKYTKIAELNASNYDDIISYTNKNLYGNKTYYYKIRISYKNTSNYSSVKYVKTLN